MAKPSQPRSASNPPTTEDVRDCWDKVALAWARWEAHFCYSNWPVTVKMLTGLGLQPGMRVLDVGCGIGDPALQLATLLGPTGHVVGVDLAPAMIDVATTRASALHLCNVDFRVGAVENLSDADGGFDAAIARFTIMLLVDVDAGLRKLRQLLRPGGRLAISTWTPMGENPMFRIPREQLSKVVDLPPVVNAPSPMRLSKAGELEEVLRAAGFVDVQVDNVSFYNFARSADEYVDMVCEMTVSLRMALDGLSQAQRHDFRQGFRDAVAEYEDHGVVRVPAKARVGIGMRYNPKLWIVTG